MNERLMSSDDNNLSFGFGWVNSMKKVYIWQYSISKKMVHKYSYLLLLIALCPHVVNYSSELCVIHDLGVLTMNCQLDIGAVVIVIVW
jgi:hypothetical protein